MRSYELTLYQGVKNGMHRVPERSSTSPLAPETQLNSRTVEERG